MPRSKAKDKKKTIMSYQYAANKNIWRTERKFCDELSSGSPVEVQSNSKVQTPTPDWTGETLKLNSPPTPPTPPPPSHDPLQELQIN